MSDYDAVLILGGGVREGGVLHPWVAARFDYAVTMSNDAFLVPLSAGTPHRPPPLENGFPIQEAVAGARYLVERGVSPERILIEACSYDTIGNAYFSRVVHVIPREFRRVLVITSVFHMRRTEEVFRWVYSLAGPGVFCEVEFASTPDVHLSREVLDARKVKEDDSLELFRKVTAPITSLSGLHQWLFTQHQAYAAGAGPSSRPPIDTTTY